MFVAIPADPTRPDYRQGNTLGDGYKHWFRAKFGGQRFRLFFRFDTTAKVVIYAWVNNEDSEPELVDRFISRFEQRVGALKRAGQESGELREAERAVAEARCWVPRSSTA